MLMLILSVVLAHVLELSSRLPMPSLDSPVAQLLFGSEQGLLLTRSAVFCIYALGAALGTLLQERHPITRDSLREPFSIQAFLVCPFVVLFSAGELLARTGARWPAFGLMAFAVGWYIVARAAAYRALHHSGWGGALALVCASFLLTTLAIVAISLLLIA
ncbi:MAG: hypothetical protein QM719_05665 [Thermomonas sp.]